ncbi:MAG: 3-isopropylmalate dehydrogenase [Deltaproteobacteria bacterium]|nr:3-isopropylmalate dehydrogenase [Deltaproteobacteria bacterium]
MKTKRIAVLAGDGIGEEVVREAVKVLELVGEKGEFQFVKALVGGQAFDEYGEHLPGETVKVCRNSDAILFGSVGGPVSESHLLKWKNCEVNSILALRKEFGFLANFRPARVYSDLVCICPLKEDIVAYGVDLLIVRELLGDIYFGEHSVMVEDGKRVAIDIARYDEDEIRAVAHVAFKAAQKRSGRLTSVDKANVLETSRLWRQTVHEVGEAEYPDVELSDMLVDNCAMQLIKNPSQFDVILCSNFMGDILSDAAAVLPGSLGLMPSASISASGFGLYEPSGGSAQDIAGMGVANPIAQILSAAMMLAFSFEMFEEASLIESAVELALAEGYRTKDIYSEGKILVGTQEMGDIICSKLMDITRR